MLKKKRVKEENNLFDKMDKNLDKDIDKKIKHENKKLIKKRSIMHKHKNLQKYFDKAGIKKEGIFLKIFYFCLAFVLLFDIAFFIINYNVFEIRYIVAMTILTLTFGLAILYVLALVIFYTYLDLRIYFRTKEIEEHLPELFFLTSSNLRAGMLIDQALINAVRPKFGALAEEMEVVMKDVMAGKNLTDSLKKFSNKYDSMILQRSMDIIISGIESGASISGTLNKIAINLSDLSLQKKEMSASVTTYIIFILFASIVVAPVLLALAGSILEVIKGLIGNLSQTGDGGSSGISFISFTVPELTQRDYRIFAISMVAVLSTFSSMIVSLIRKGSVNQGIRYIPIYMIISIAIFFISYFILQSFVGGMFIF